MTNHRGWSDDAIAVLEAELRRSSDSHLIRFPLPAFGDVHLYLKDESLHPSGSLKHRLARSLILCGICDGRIGKDTVLVDASSGSTAVSEAFFAKLLGLKFCAVLPRTTTQSKVDAIIGNGGTCHFVDNAEEVYAAATKLTEELNGCYLDQFTFAERATDWREQNIADSIFRQMELEPHRVPSWVVMSAGTGGTSATIGRYLRYRRLQTRLCVPDAEFSAFYDGWTTGNRDSTCARPSRIEGVGRPRVEQSFVPGVVDVMLKVPDAVSIAACHVLSRHLGRKMGASTGTNFLGALWAADRMRREHRPGSVVTIICDGGDRYADTYFNAAWLQANGFALDRTIELVERALDAGGFANELLLAEKASADFGDMRLAS